MIYCDFVEHCIPEKVQKTYFRSLAILITFNTYKKGAEMLKSLTSESVQDRRDFRTHTLLVMNDVKPNSVSSCMGDREGHSQLSYYYILYRYL